MLDAKNLEVLQKHKEIIKNKRTRSFSLTSGNNLDRNLGFYMDLVYKSQVNLDVSIYYKSLKRNIFIRITDYRLTVYTGKDEALQKSAKNVYKKFHEAMEVRRK